MRDVRSEKTEPRWIHWLSTGLCCLVVEGLGTRCDPAKLDLLDADRCRRGAVSTSKTTTRLDPTWFGWRESMEHDSLPVFVPIAPSRERIGHSGRCLAYVVQFHGVGIG